MTVRKRYGKYYYTDFRLRGKRIVQKIPGGISNREVAQQWENDFKLRLLRGEIGIEQQNPDVSALVERYLAWSRNNKASASCLRDTIALRNIVSGARLRKASDITPAAIEAYKEQRLGTASKRTVNIEVKTLKAMLNKAASWNLIASNPIADVGRIRGPESKPVDYLTTSEIEALLRAATPAYRQIIYTYLKTGMRKNELVFLEWTDIDFDRRQIRVVNKEGHPTKTYADRYIPMDRSLVSLFRALGPKTSGYVFTTARETLRRNNLLREIQRTGIKAGISHKVTVNLLRHTCCSHLVMSGVNLVSVQRIMGHSDFRTTLRYSHLAPDHLKTSVERLPY